MDPLRGHGFGWTTPCPADGEAASLRHVEALWADYFPDAGDYEVRRRELPGSVRFVVTRGDFHAELEVSGGHWHGAPRLRLSGSAGSRRVRHTERSSTATIERLRLAGGLLGGILVGWSASHLLTAPPQFTIDMLFVLGGLLLVVMLVVLVMTGAGIGGWLGQEIAGNLWATTLRALDGDSNLRTDLQRWRALVRSLAHHRDLLAGGRRGLPFRCEFTDAGAHELHGAAMTPAVRR